jgi:hypothetical protein
VVAGIRDKISDDPLPEGWAGEAVQWQGLFRLQKGEEEICPALF